MNAPIGKINTILPGLMPGSQGIKPGETAPEGKGFGDIFGNMIQSVNDLQMEAGKQQELLASGEAEDLHQVMIAAEKAGIGLDLLLEVRNKLVDAYQTFMRMPM